MCARRIAWLRQQRAFQWWQYKQAFHRRRRKLAARVYGGGVRRLFSVWCLHMRTVEVGCGRGSRSQSGWGKMECWKAKGLNMV